MTSFLNQVDHPMLMFANCDFLSEGFLVAVLIVEQFAKKVIGID